MSNALMDLYIALADLEAINIAAEFEKLLPAEKALFSKKLDKLLKETQCREVASHVAN